MRPRAFSREVPAAVTAFVSLTILLVIAMICVMLEGARAQAGRWYFRQTVNSAGESLMANYRSDLWKDYRLLLYYDDGQMDEKLEEFFLPYEKAGGGASFLAFDGGTISVTQRLGVMEQGGGLFIQNANAAMVFEEGKGLTEKFLKETGLLKQIKRAASFIQELLSYGNQIVDLERSLGKLGSRGEKMKNSAKSLGTACAGFRTSVENLREIAGKEVTPELKEALTTDFLVMQGEVLSYGTLFAERMESLAFTASGYSASAGSLGEELTALSDSLEEEKELFQEDIWKVLSGEMQNVRSYTETAGEKEELLKKVDDLCGVYDTITPFLQELADVDPNTATAGELDDLCVRLDAYCSSLGAFSGLEKPGGLENMSEPGSDFSLQVSLTRLVSDLFLGGVLSLFVEDISKVSKKTLSSGPLPSASLGEGDYDGNILSQVTDRILFVDYLATYFYGYPSGKERALEYEWEYLIHGQVGDRSNLVNECKDLYLIREGVRFLQNLMDGAKRQKAAQSASSCVGFTGNPAVIYLAQLLFLGVWAGEDALLDVRALLRGEKVPFLPMGAEKLGEFSYQDYAKLQMMLMPMHTLCGRAMDLIQNQVRTKEKDFCMDRCLAAFQVTANGSMNWIFGALPFAAAWSGQSSSGQVMSCSADFRYQ